MDKDRWGKEDRITATLQKENQGEKNIKECGGGDGGGGG